MKLTKIQSNAVNQLLDFYYQDQSEVLFNAPTGSGKTFMIANFISKIIENNQTDKLVFVIATISSSELPLQFANKLKNYNNYLPVSLDVEHKPSPSELKKLPKDYEPNLHAKKNKVFIIGKSSFTKSSIFMKRGIFEGFRQQIENEGYKLIYIRDEAHYGSKSESLNKNDQAFENQIRQSASFILEMSASPKVNLENVVTIKEKDLEDNDGKFLLKTKAMINDGISKSKIREINDLDLLEIALNKFIESKQEYLTLENEINPAMLIQVDSKTEKNFDQFDEELNNIKKAIEAKGLIWYQYFGDSKQGSTKEIINLDKISQINSTVDVIIFKIGPATGWDIPRANMLLQLRNINSQTLNLQTVGRIKRNPNKDLSKNDITNRYYLYSNYQQPTREMDTYFLKEKYHQDVFYCGKLTKELIDENEFRTKFQSWFRNNIFNNSKNYSLIKANYEEYFTNNIKNESIKLDKIDLVDNNKVRIAYYKKEIQDLIDLRIFVNDLKGKYPRIFNLIETTITNQANSERFELDQFIFALYITHWADIKNKFNLYEQEIEKVSYSLDNSFNLPKRYIIWKDKKQKMQPFEFIKNIYPYRNSEKDTKYTQTLDSNPEVAFMETTINQLSDAIELNPDNNIKIFTKNPALSGVFFEYLNKEGLISKAYIDFIIQIGDYHLYIEIKADGDKDYDEDKTKLIEKGFENYIKDTNNDKIIFVMARMHHWNNQYSGKSYPKFYTNEPWIKKESKNDESLSLVRAIQHLINKN